jgi:hypothetical protein
MSRSPFAIRWLGLLAVAVLPVMGSTQSARPRACLTPAQAARPSGPVPVLQIRDMERSLDEWQRDRMTVDSAARLAAFRRLVVDAWPDIFGPVFRRPEDGPLVEYLDWLEPRLPAVHRIMAAMRAEIGPASRRVAAVFPSLAEKPVPVVIGLSLGRTNGTVRLVGGEPLLFIGADVQTVVSDGRRSAAAVLEHELVHVAHARTNPAVYAQVDAGVRGEPTPVYFSLFSEGLAAWATGCVSPSRTTAERLLSPTLDREARAAAGRLLPEFATVLEAADPAGYGDWFFVGGRRKDIPERFAYWVGDRMVGAMARRIEPRALLELDSTAILRETRAALESLAREFGSSRDSR